MPVIVVKSKDGGRSYLLEEGRPLFVGRAKECDITLPTPTVSRRHAVLLYKNGVCGIKDLGSFNGTLVNDRPIDRPRHISDADVVRISFYSFHLHMNENAVEPGGGDGGNVGANAPFAAAALPMASADETIGIRMDAARQETPRRTGGTTRYGNSDILLPRAMQQGAASGSPDAANSFFPNRHDTAYFKEPPLPDDPDGTGGAFSAEFAGLASDGSAADPGDASRPAGLTSLDESDDRDLGETIDAGSSLTRADAEAVIPLIDKSAADPTLTLEEDEATNAALEKLIEDLPTYHRERLEGPEAAMEELLAEEPPVIGDPASPDETASSFMRSAPAEQGDASTFDTGAFDAVSGDAPRPRGRAAEETRVIEKRPAPLSDTPDAIEDIPLSAELMNAVNARLSLYALLFDLSEERRVMRAEAGENLDPDARQELDRQDAELDNLPTTDEAARRLADLQAAQKRDAEGEPRKISGEMRAAESLAVSQLLLIRESNLEALPAVYKQAYRLAFDEPLARELTKAKIAHGRLLGGAMYLLALEAVSSSAKEERRRVTARIKQIPGEGLDPDSSNVFAKIGQMATNLKNREEIKKETARLEDEGKTHGNRADLAAREKRFMLKTLAREFRQTYAAAALHFVPMRSDMPVAVRAFLRYGAIGFKPWWMTDELREFITGDCTDNVLSAMEHEWNAVNILYFDEYLEAVAEMECSPSPDERLDKPGRDIADLKTDRAYRRIVNAHSYNVLMERMLAGLDDRLRNLDRETVNIGERIAEKEQDSTLTARNEVAALRTEQQAVGIRRTNLQTHIARIETEVVTSILDSVQESEGLFRRGELVMPEAEALIRREVAALFENARRMEGKREAFMPLVLRENFPLDRDMVSIRGAIRMRMTALESLDPGVFSNVIIPAKKRINRVELRISPTMVILPVSGQHCVCAMGREGMEGGHLLLPIRFPRENMRNRQLIHLLADFRWETARASGRKETINSDTLAGAFMRVRWEWRNFPRAKREKGLIFSELGDMANWRRVYELYLADAKNGGKKLFQANPDIHAAIVGKYIDLPHGAPLLRKTSTGTAAAVE